MEMETPGFGDRSNKPYSLKNKDIELIYNVASLVLMTSKEIDTIRSWQKINTLLNAVVVVILGIYYYKLFLVA